MGKGHLDPLLASFTSSAFYTFLSPFLPFSVPLPVFRFCTFVVFLCLQTPLVASLSTFFPSYRPTLQRRRAATRDQPPWVRGTDSSSPDMARGRAPSPGQPRTPSQAALDSTAPARERGAQPQRFPAHHGVGTGAKWTEVKTSDQLRVKQQGSLVLFFCFSIAREHRTSLSGQ